MICDSSLICEGHGSGRKVQRGVILRHEEDWLCYFGDFHFTAAAF